MFAASQFTPPLGNLSGNVNYISGQTFSNTIVDVSGSSTVNYTIGSSTLGPGTFISYTYPSPTHITGIIKTPTVYNSSENAASTVYVMYSVTDAFGRSQCSPTGVSVSLSVGLASSICPVFMSPAAPYSGCWLTVNQSVFTSSGSSLPVSVSLSVNSVLVQNTLLGSVTLAPIPSQSVPSGVGIYFQLPIYVAVPGDVVTVQMYVAVIYVLFISLLAQVH